MNRADLHKVVSLTFDERPLVRKAAAHLLAKVDDPAAIFALIELSYDKDLDVKATAQGLLQKKKSAEEEVLSFADVFGPKEKVQLGREPLLNAEQRRERVLSPITKLFEKKFGKGRADMLKSKMMPTIEKIYLQNRQDIKDENQGKTAIQEILTSYLEAMEDVGGSEDIDLSSEEEQLEVLAMEKEVKTPIRHTDIGKGTGTDQPEMQTMLKDNTRFSEDDIKEIGGYEESGNAFKKAYDIMALSAGDEKVMKREMGRMLNEYKKDLKLAFLLARRRFKETNVTSLAKIKDGMRNINTESLRIKSVENVEIKHKRKKENIMRIVVHDEQGATIPLYIEPERTAMLKTGIVLKVTGAHAKKPQHSNEVGLVLGPKSNVYIVL